MKLANEFFDGAPVFFLFTPVLLFSFAVTLLGYDLAFDHTKCWVSSNFTQNWVETTAKICASEGMRYTVQTKTVHQIETTTPIGNGLAGGLVTVLGIQAVLFLGTGVLWSFLLRLQLFNPTIESIEKFLNKKTAEGDTEFDNSAETLLGLLKSRCKGMLGFKRIFISALRALFAACLAILCFEMATLLSTTTTGTRDGLNGYQVIMTKMGFASSDLPERFSTEFMCAFDIRGQDGVKSFWTQCVSDEASLIAVISALAWIWLMLASIYSALLAVWFVLYIAISLWRPDIFLATVSAMTAQEQPSSVHKLRRTVKAVLGADGILYFQELQQRGYYRHLSTVLRRLADGQSRPKIPIEPDVRVEEKRV